MTITLKIMKPERERFITGNVYSFRTNGRYAAAVSSGAGRTRKYSFVGIVNGRNVRMFMFMSLTGKWRETFTPYQLEDYTIGKAV